MGLASVPPPPPPVVPGDVVAGKYRVDRAIAAGGMGLVFAARHVELDQAVALKFMRAELRGQISTSRFTLEARATAKLRSAHVARVFDVGVLDDGTPFMVMELLDGIDLERLREERGRLTADIATELLTQACDAIAEAHDAGIIHRDLKPANLFLTKTPQGAPFVKVLDFGISKAIGRAAESSTATQAGTIMGSPPYMSPETLKSSKNADVASDIWGLGIILYELVTGRLPFEGEGVGDLALKVHHEEPSWPAELDPDIPREYDAIVRKCLRKNPAERYRSVLELREALSSFAAGRSAHGMTLSLRTSQPRILVVDEAEEPVPPTPRTSERQRKARAATTQIHGPSSPSDPPPARYRPQLVAAAAVLGVAIVIALALAVVRPSPTIAASQPPPVDRPPESLPAHAPTLRVPAVVATTEPQPATSTVTPRPAASIAAPTRVASPPSVITSTTKKDPAPPPVAATAPDHTTAPLATAPGGRALRDRGF